jgi:DNA polymerase III alpha subunit
LGNGIKLEGITRNTGKHAGGVVIAPGKITDYSAVLCDADGTTVLLNTIKMMLKQQVWSNSTSWVYVT